MNVQERLNEIRQDMEQTAPTETLATLFKQHCEYLLSLVDAMHKGDSARDDVFAWGTPISISRKRYWLNRCATCPTSLAPTYHVIKGNAQPSLNELMED